MDEGKSNVKIIRATVLINSFATQYFEVVIIVYLLSKGVTPWVAVSIPLVIELFNNISRIMDKFLKIAITVDYKKYHLFFIVSCAIIYILISMCRDVYSIYLFCALLGVINGINYSCITRINTSNSKYEAACFFEEERSYTIGATLGLIVSQIMYDCNPLIYVIGFIVVAIIGIILNKKITNIKIKDDMKPIEHVDTIPKKEKRQLLIITTLYGIMVGIWCIGLSGLDQIVPLITSKTGYLNSIYTGVELIALFIISGALLEKIKTKNKLLFWEMIIALMDILYLLIATIFQNMYALIGIFFLMGITSTLGDPIWGSIISKYSQFNRKKYVIITKIYFFIKIIFSLISLIVCRQCVIVGIDSFKFLAIILIAGIIIMYLIANEVNKRIFGHAI